MGRPTALIRESLLLAMIKVALEVAEEPLKDQIAKQLLQVKHQLRCADVEVIDSEIRALDVWVQYRYKGRLFDFCYMRAMLDAEARSRLLRWREGTKEDALDIRAL